MTQSVLFFRRCGLLLLLPWVAAAELRISEICPKPGELDPNGLESGWVEFVNDGAVVVDMVDYRLIRVNRSKKTDIGKFGNLPSRTLARANGSSCTRRSATPRARPGRRPLRRAQAH